MNRSKKFIFILTGSLLFLSPLTAKSALNKSVDDFSNININISQKIKEKSKTKELKKKFQKILIDKSKEFILIKEIMRDVPPTSPEIKGMYKQIKEIAKQITKVKLSIDKISIEEPNLEEMLGIQKQIVEIDKQLKDLYLSITKLPREAFEKIRTQREIKELLKKIEKM